MHFLIVVSYCNSGHLDYNFDTSFRPHFPLEFTALRCNLLIYKFLIFLNRVVDFVLFTDFNHLRLLSIAYGIL